MAKKEKILTAKQQATFDELKANACIASASKEQTKIIDNAYSAELKYRLFYAEATPSNNVLKGMHYMVYAKLRNSWKNNTLKEIAGLKIKPIEFSYIEIDRHSSGGGLDWDNAIGGLKPMLDCLVSPSDRNPDGIGLILDDNPDNMPECPKLKQFKAPPGLGFTIVRIFELTKLKV